MHACSVESNYCVLEIDVAYDSSLAFVYLFSLLFVCVLKVCGNIRGS
jgi:hypothetical protein